MARSIYTNTRHPAAGTLEEHHASSLAALDQGQDKQDNEMCMYIAYYYPEVQDGGFFVNCAQGDSYGTGTKTCAESLACLQACPPGDAPGIKNGVFSVGACSQKCMVDSCPSASAPINAFFGCAAQRCATECSCGDCASCVAAKCAAEFTTCQSQKGC
jgi:hypothetical protein